ncbi:MAG: transcriptional regulator [Rhodospirillaceae bacterium]|nr:transcriptional regulator [Rhodospirillaceae bacterium]
MPHPVDVTVGNRVREMRIRKGLSQQALGDQVGVSFQQIQKYERGTNRMGSSRLIQIADVLDVPVSTFFEGLGKSETTNVSSASEEGPLNVKASKVAHDWQRIGDERLQTKVAEMMRALSRG